MTSARWIEGMRKADVLAVAGGLGLKVKAKPAPGWISPCPACGADTRHTKRRDRRGAVGIRRDRKGWHCFQCDAGGDALRLVELVIAGGCLRNLDTAKKAEVRGWCEDFLGIARGPASSRHHSGPRVHHAARLPPPAPAPEYPPADEVAGLWRACVSVLEHEPTRTYLEGRGINALSVHDRDLARALPDGAPLPAWARFGNRTWLEASYRLMVPTFDASGTMRSVIARRIVDADTGTPKSLPPKGYARAGLVMANALGRAVLESGTKPAWWSGPPLRFVVTEGEIDYLTADTEASDADEHAPVVLGIVSGSVTGALMARVPSGTELFVETDGDDQGAKYAAKILNSCRDRLRKHELRLVLPDCFEAEWSKLRAVVRLKGASRGA